jgi:hypothetical protein
MNLSSISRKDSSSSTSSCDIITISWLAILPFLRTWSTQALPSGGDISLLSEIIDILVEVLIFRSPLLNRNMHQQLPTNQHTGCISTYLCTLSCFLVYSSYRLRQSFDIIPHKRSWNLHISLEVSWAITSPTEVYCYAEMKTSSIFSRPFPYIALYRRNVLAAMTTLILTPRHSH